jgi:hypothetical protein
LTITGSSTLHRPAHQEVRERRDDQGHPDPRLPAGVGEALADLLQHAGGPLGRGPRLGPGAQHRQGGHADQEAGGVDRERGGGAGGRDQQPAERRPGELRGEHPARGAERVGRQQQVGGEQLGQERGRGGQEERAGRAGDRPEHDQVPQPQLVTGCQQRDDSDRQRLHQVGGEHHQAPRQPVADHAAEQHQHDPGRGPGEHHQRQCRRA